MILSIRPLVRCSRFTLRVGYFCSKPCAAFCQPGRFWMLVSVVTRSSIGCADGLGSASLPVVAGAAPPQAASATTAGAATTAPAARLRVQDERLAMVAERIQGAAGAVVSIPPS